MTNRSADRRPRGSDRSAVADRHPRKSGRSVVVARPAATSGPAVVSAAWRVAVREHWRKAVHWLVVGAGVGYLAWQAPGFVGEVARSGGRLVGLRWDWLAVAAGCGVAALVVYAELHRQLLTVGGAHLSVPAVQGINLVQNAVSTTIPVVGGAGGLAYAIQQLRRRGVDAALASWSVLVAGLLDTLVLVALGAVALGWAGRIPVPLALVLAGAVAAVAVGGWSVVTHPVVLRRGLHGLLRLGGLLPVGCGECRRARAERIEQGAERLAARIAVLRPGGGRWLVLVGLTVVSWLLDYLTLVVVVVALGVTVPLPVLAVGFLVVQGSIALQVFPGGAGLAETGLLGVLVAAGVPASSGVACVLVYRSISWLGLSVLGWAVYAVSIHRGPARPHQHVAELVPA